MLISLSDELNDLGQSANYSGPDHVLADCRPLAMKRALRNLMENAVKYGDDAQVSLEESAKSLTIRIADKGGVPEDQFEIRVRAVPAHRTSTQPGNRRRGPRRCHRARSSCARTVARSLSPMPPWLGAGRYRDAA